MKPNLEISLKFWITMIVFFSLWLSFPLYDYFVNESPIEHVKLVFFSVGVLITCLILIIDLLLRNSELKSKLNKETFFKDVSMQTIEDYETQIKEQEDHIKELKKSFKDAVVEITELRSKNKQLDDTNNILIEKFKYWKERALHKKHTKKEVEIDNSEYWELKKEIDYMKELFNTNKKYKMSHIKPSKENLLFLIGNDNQPYLVYKKDFKPVK